MQYFGCLPIEYRYIGLIKVTMLSHSEQISLGIVSSPQIPSYLSIQNTAEGGINYDLLEWPSSAFKLILYTQVLKL
jgi:hypothetical protein